MRGMIGLLEGAQASGAALGRPPPVARRHQVKSCAVQLPNPRLLHAAWDSCCAEGVPALVRAHSIWPPAPLCTT